MPRTNPCVPAPVRWQWTACLWLPVRPQSFCKCAEEACGCLVPFHACSCAVALDRLAVAASVAKVSAPGGGWRVFEQRLQALTRGEVSEPWNRCAQC
eukprot:1160000-Pelagomonas_calceolata.AAC.15